MVRNSPRLKQHKSLELPPSNHPNRLDRNSCQERHKKRQKREGKEKENVLHVSISKRDQNNPVNPLERKNEGAG